MSTDQTPAMVRAAEVLLHPSDPYRCNTPNPAIAPMIAREVVSAALTDPDGDVIARTLRVHSVDNLTGACRCGWEDRDLDGPGQADHQADAVRAAILGEA